MSNPSNRLSDGRLEDVPDYKFPATVEAIKAGRIPAKVPQESLLVIARMIRPILRQLAEEEAKMTETTPDGR